MEILLQLGGCAKGNNSLLIFFCYVQRDCQHYFSTQQSKVYLRGSPPVEVHQIFHIFSLLMTTLVFVELLERSVPILKGFWMFMSQRKVKNLIMTKHLFFFCHNTPLDIQNDIKNRFGAEIIQQHGKYLGLPSLVGKNKCNTFWQLIERLESKLSG